jgi:peptidoglycan/xylan/chitin deacetylase (PgdA/CDA1 family)
MGSSVVPNHKNTTYYAAVHLLHRIQAARARRISSGVDVWHTGVRVLCYHRVSSDRDELSVTPSAFRSQMEFVMHARASAQTLDDALDKLREGASGRHVCVTFDDGYRDNLENAIPVLRDLAIPATIFVASGMIDGTAPVYWYDQPPPLLTWSELREINDEGLVAIGAHSRTHRALPKLPDEEAWEEIAGSRGDLEKRLGRPVTSFAYPSGLYGEREVRMAREAGYRVAVTCEPGANGPGQRPHELRRLIVGPRDDLKMFEAKLTGLLDEPWGVSDGLKRATRAMRRATAPGRRAGARTRQGAEISDRKSRVR